MNKKEYLKKVERLLLHNLKHRWAGVMRVDSEWMDLEELLEKTRALILQSEE